MEAFVTKILDDDDKGQIIIVRLPSGDSKEFHYSAEVWKGVKAGDTVNQFQLQRADQWEETYLF